MQNSYTCVCKPGTTGTNCQTGKTLFYSEDTIPSQRELRALDSVVWMERHVFRLMTIQLHDAFVQEDSREINAIVNRLISTIDHKDISRDWSVLFHSVQERRKLLYCSEILGTFFQKNLSCLTLNNAEQRCRLHLFMQFGLLRRQLRKWVTIWLIQLFLSSHFNSRIILLQTTRLVFPLRVPMEELVSIPHQERIHARARMDGRELSATWVW